MSKVGGMAAINWCGGIGLAGWVMTLLARAGLLTAVVWGVTVLFPAVGEDDRHGRRWLAPSGGDLRSSHSQTNDLHHDPAIPDHRCAQ